MKLSFQGNTASSSRYPIDSVAHPRLSPRRWSPCGHRCVAGAAGGKLDRFRWVKAPSTAELSQLTHTIAHRIGRYLERQGLLVRDAEQSYLTLDEPEEDSMNQLQGYSITYRITVDPHQGRKVFTLQTLPGTEGPSIDAADRGGRFFAARQFSQHASVAVKVSERKKLEQISGGGPAAASADRRCPKNDFH